MHIGKGHSEAVFASGWPRRAQRSCNSKPGNHVIAPKVMYWALRNWLANTPRCGACRSGFVDMSNLDEVKRAVRPEDQVDLERKRPPIPVDDFRHRRDLRDRARGGAMTAVTPPWQARPHPARSHLGADVVIHSATKYLNSHSGSGCGALIARPIPLLAARQAVRVGAFWAPSGPGSCCVAYARCICACRRRAVLPRCSRSSSANTLVSEVLYPACPRFPTCHRGQSDAGRVWRHVVSIPRERRRRRRHCHRRQRQCLEARDLARGQSLIEHLAPVEGPRDRRCPPICCDLSVGIGTWTI